MSQKKKKRSVFKIVLIVILAIVLFCVIAAGIGLMRSRSKNSGGYLPFDEVRTLDGGDRIGEVKVPTLPLEEGLQLRRASYTSSGRVIYTAKDGSDTVFVICDDSDPVSGRVLQG